jgi:hypothetical protein
MLAFARIANWTGGALLVVAALGFLIFLPEAISDYTREPEDVWAIIGWTAVLCLLAALCFVNAVKVSKTGSGAIRWLTAINVAVLIALGALKAFDTAYGLYDDPVLTALVALCALGPASAVIASLQSIFLKRH